MGKAQRAHQLSERLQIALTLAAVVCLAGCVTLAPRYNQPAAPVPGEWPQGPAYQASPAMAGAPAAPALNWREFFSDEPLGKIIELALANNRDLRLAALNVEQARALYGIQRAELWPAVNGQASGSRQRASADLVSSGKDRTTAQYDAAVGISSWEIDFLGRLRSLSDQALEQYLATEQARRGARILLTSEVASGYFTLAADRENLKLAEQTLKTQQTTYELIRRRFEVGVANSLDVKRAETQAEAARVDVVRYTQLVAQDKNALDLLAGSQVPEALLPQDLATVNSPREVSPGLPSETLLRRPDILAAEHRLKAAHAFIGAARAAFFPRISLTAALGTASSELSGLFSTDSGTWLFTPQAVLPIFDGRVWAAWRVSKVEREISLAEYEKAIQTAFREVADSLAVHDTMEEQLAAQQALVSAAAETHRLSMLRYDKGMDSYLSVLDSQRSLYGAKQGLTALHLARLVNQVRLYAVLGGGDADEGGQQDRETAEKKGGTQR